MATFKTGLKTVGLQPVAPSFPSIRTISPFLPGVDYSTPVTRNRLKEREHVTSVGDLFLGNPLTGTLELQHTLEDAGLGIFKDIPILNRVVGTGIMLNDRFIQPVLKGDLGTATINTFETMGQSLDVLANPVKSLFKGAGGGTYDDFLRSMGMKQGEYRKDYQWDTGNFVSDLVLEVISDPVNWFTWGTSAISKRSLKEVTDEAYSNPALMKTLMSEDPDVLIKIAGKRSASNLQLKKDLAELLLSSKNLDVTDNAIRGLLSSDLTTANVKMLLSDAKQAAGQSWYNQYRTFSKLNKTAKSLDRAITKLAIGVTPTAWGVLAVKKMVQPTFRALWNRTKLNLERYLANPTEPIETVYKQTDQMVNQMYVKEVHDFDQILQRQNLNLENIEKRYLEIAEALPPSRRTLENVSSKFKAELSGIYEKKAKVMNTTVDNLIHPNDFDLLFKNLDEMNKITLTEYLEQKTAIRLAIKDAVEANTITPEVTQTKRSASKSKKIEKVTKKSYKDLVTERQVKLKNFEDFRDAGSKKFPNLYKKSPVESLVEQVKELIPKTDSGGTRLYEPGFDNPDYFFNIYNKTKEYNSILNDLGDISRAYAGGAPLVPNDEIQLRFFNGDLNHNKYNVLNLTKEDLYNMEHDLVAIEYNLKNKLNDRRVNNRIRINTIDNTEFYTSINSALDIIDDARDTLFNGVSYIEQVDVSGKYYTLELSSLGRFYEKDIRLTSYIEDNNPEFYKALVTQGSKQRDTLLELAKYIEEAHPTLINDADAIRKLIFTLDAKEAINNIFAYTNEELITLSNDLLRLINNNEKAFKMVGDHLDNIKSLIFNIIYNERNKYAIDVSVAELTSKVRDKIARSPSVVVENLNRMLYPDDGFKYYSEIDELFTPIIEHISKNYLIDVIRAGDNLGLDSKIYQYFDQQSVGVFNSLSQNSDVLLEVLNELPIDTRITYGVDLIQLNNIFGSSLYGTRLNEIYDEWERQLVRAAEDSTIDYATGKSLIESLKNLDQYTNGRNNASIVTAFKDSLKEINMLNLQKNEAEFTKYYLVNDLNTYLKNKSIVDNVKTYGEEFDTWGVGDNVFTTSIRSETIGFKKHVPEVIPYVSEGNVLNLQMTPDQLKSFDLYLKKGEQMFSSSLFNQDQEFLTKIKNALKLTYAEDIADVNIINNMSDSMLLSYYNMSKKNMIPKADLFLNNINITNEIKSVATLEALDKVYTELQDKVFVGEDTVSEILYNVEIPVVENFVDEEVQKILKTPAKSVGSGIDRIPQMRAILDSDADSYLDIATEIEKTKVLDPVANVAKQRDLYRIQWDNRNRTMFSYTAEELRDYIDHETGGLDFILFTNSNKYAFNNIPNAIDNLDSVGLKLYEFDVEDRTITIISKDVDGIRNANYKPIVYLSKDTEPYKQDLDIVHKLLDKQKVISNVKTPSELLTGEMVNPKTLDTLLRMSKLPDDVIQKLCQNIDILGGNFGMYNTTIFGQPGALNVIADLTSPILSLTDEVQHYTSTRLDKCLKANLTGALFQKNKVSKYLSMFANDDYSISVAGRKMFADATDHDIEMFFKKGNYTAALLTRDSKGLPKLTHMFVTNRKTLNKAMDAGAIMLPYEIYRNATMVVNKRHMPSKLFNMYKSTIVGTYKTMWLMSVGYPTRNFIDSMLYKNLNESGGMTSLFSVIKNEYAASRMLKEYSDIQKKIFDLGVSKYGNMTYSKNLVKEILGTLDDETVSRFYLTDLFINSSASGGFSKAMEEYMLNVNKNGTDYLGFAWERMYNEQVLHGRYSPATLIQNVNSWVEQTARFGLYLQLIQDGSSSTDAIRKIISTHFDYSFKNTEQEWLEHLFWFSTFPLNNLMYYVNEGLTKSPDMLKLIMDIQEQSWNSGDYTWDKVRNSPYLQGQVLSGNIRIGNTLIRTGFSVFDFFSIMNDPIGETLDRLNPFISVPIGLDDPSQLNPANSMISRAAQIIRGDSLVPSVYTTLNRYDSSRYPRRTLYNETRFGKWTKYPSRTKRARQSYNKKTRVYPDKNYHDTMKVYRTYKQLKGLTTTKALSLKFWTPYTSQMNSIDTFRRGVKQLKTTIKKG